METMKTLRAPEIPAELIRWRIARLRDACAFISDTSAHHKDPEVFRSIIDLAIHACEIEPVSLAQAFEVNTATVSRWRTGRNAPHPRERPFVIEKISEQIALNADRLAKELDHLGKDGNQSAKVERRQRQHA